MSDDEVQPDSAELADGFADRQRQAARLQAAGQEKKQPRGSSVAVAKVSGQALTAGAWNFCWRFYIATLTLSGLYLLVHVLARYLLQWKVFCPAQNPFFKVPGSSSSHGELAWVIAAVVAALPPLIIILFIHVIVSTIAFAVDNPGRTFTCTVRSLWKFLGFKSNPTGDSGFIDKLFNCLLSGSGGGTLVQ